jgi:Sulfotransferase domain
VDQSRLIQAQKTLEVASEHIRESSPERAAALLNQLFNQGGWSGEVEQVIAHNLVGALRHVVEAALARGEIEAAGEAARQAMLVPIPDETPETMLRHRADFFTAMGSSFFSRRLIQGALLCQRHAIALYPCPSFQNNLINALAELKTPSLLTDYSDILEPQQLAPHLLLACQPKSGSTFLKNVLAEVTGFRDIYLFHAAELSAQELFYPVLLEFADTPTVTHQHCRATEANVQLLQAFGMRAIVLVRNLYDVLVSLREFFTGGAIVGTRFDVAHWHTLSPERQMDLLIDLVVPWHLEFLASWQQAERELRLPLLWLTYEEAMRDKQGTIAQILSFYGLPGPPEKIQEAIATVSATPEKNRMNKGVSGRGDAALTPSQKARILHLAAYFPSTDFSRYGL